MHGFKSGNEKFYSGSLRRFPAWYHPSLLLPQFLSSFRSFSCCLTVLVPLFDIHKMHYSAVQPPLASREVTLARFTRKKRDEQISLHCSTAVQSSGQQLGCLLACQDTSLPCKLLCFFFSPFLFRHSHSSKASPLSLTWFGRRKRSFHHISKFTLLKQFEPMLREWSHVQVDLWLQGQRVGVSSWELFQVCLAAVTKWLITAGNKIGSSGLQGYWLLYVCHNRCILYVSVCCLVLSAQRCWSLGRILGHYHFCSAQSTWWHLLTATDIDAGIQVQVRLMACSFFKSVSCDFCQRFELLWEWNTKHHTHA